MADGARSIHECAEEGEVAAVGDALETAKPGSSAELRHALPE